MALLKRKHGPQLIAVLFCLIITGCATEDYQEDGAAAANAEGAAATAANNDALDAPAPVADPNAIASQPTQAPLQELPQEMPAVQSPGEAAAIAPAPAVVEAAPLAQATPVHAPVLATHPEAADVPQLSAPARADLGSSSPAMSSTADTSTRYGVIDAGFNQANEMPDPERDFDSIDEPSARVTCLGVKGSDPNKVAKIVVKKMKVDANAGVDLGPLFSGPDSGISTRLVMGKNNGWINSQNLTPEIRRVFELNKAPGALVIRINENRFGIYKDIGSPSEMWLKKATDGNIFFKVYRVGADQTRNEVFGGYCFQKRNS